MPTHKQQTPPVIPAQTEPLPPRPDHLPAWEQTYLRVLADSGQKVKAAENAGIHRSEISHRRRTNRAFATREREALEVSHEIFESEAIRRAVEGVTEERPDRQGKPIKHIEYSDSILIKLLEKHDPAWNPKLARDEEQPETFRTAAERKAAFLAARAAAAEQRALHLRLAAKTSTESKGEDSTDSD